jgi:group I intron endonuclease
MQAGIYAIRNKINGKLYIGSTINFKQRWQQHKSNLKNNRHHSQILQNAWNKYGEDAFEFCVVQEVLDIETLGAMEQSFLDTYESYKKENGYNIQAVVDRTTAAKPETTKKLSIRFSDDEDIILGNYCKKHRRTKNDVIREFVRSLAKEEQELPDGWHESEYNGKVVGEYRGYRIRIYPLAQGFEGVAYNIETKEYLPSCSVSIPIWIPQDNIGLAISRMEDLIDQELDS